MLQLGECPLPSPPPQGRERVAADSGVAGRLKKNARNINGRNFSGSLYRKADGTNAARFFQTTFEPIGRVCTARHARGGLELQGKWGARAYHTRPTCVATACLDLPLIVGRLKNKKQPAQPVFLTESLIPTAARPLSRGRELERGQQTARFVLGRLELGCWGRLPKFGEFPLPSPPPQGRGRIAAGFAVSGGLKSNLGLQPLISGRLKRKKAANTTCFLAEPLTPTAAPSSLPWERVRERATSRKACIGAVRVLGKIAAIRGMPSPQPSPTGEGAGFSGFKRYRSSEKECPKHQQQEFFR